MLFSLRKALAQFEMPGVFLIVCILAFGLQIPWLGYYLDDWIILNAYNLGGGERLFEYAFLGNRPLVFWLWWLGFKLFGSVPIYWHIWALLWRWLTVVILWMGWRLLWPKAPRQIAFAALLFAVYPLFKQQPSALTFSFHWICFFLYGLSIYWMILSIQRRKNFYPFMLGAVLANFVQLFSQEFYVGIELFRPVVIWLVLESLVPSWKERVKRTLFYWAPYLLILGSYLVWRLVLMPVPTTDRNSPGLMYGLVSRPLQALVELATIVSQDIAEMLAGVWYKTIAPGLFTPTPLSNLVAWGLVVITSLFLFAFFKWRQPGQLPPILEQPPLAVIERPWYQTAIPVGFLAMIFGFAPGWSIGKHIYDLTGMYNDRFGLAAMFGASILIVGLMEMLLRKESYRIVLACLLVGLAVGQNFRTTTDYRWSWEKQLRFYWQLKWRAPELQSPTTIVGEGALIGYIGSWATTSAFVQMYAPEKDVHSVDYWYLDMGKANLTPHVEGNQPVIDEKSFMRYAAPENNSLVISYKPDEQQCLWVLSQTHQSSRYNSEKEAYALPLTNLNQILPESNRTLRPDIFGPEISHDWCYYFQKGDLARQFQNWEEVVRLWQDAEQKGLHPRVGIEYAPFIEGYAHTGDFKQALALTRKAFFPDYVMRDYLCETWKRIGQTTEVDANRQDALQSAIDDFGCGAEILP